jgi:hypothetical protein
MWQMIAAVAVVVVPVSTALWVLIKTEMRNQVLTQDVKFGGRFSGIEQRVAALEGRGPQIPAYRVR